MGWGRGEDGPREAQCLAAGVSTRFPMLGHRRGAAVSAVSVADSSGISVVGFFF